MRLANDAFWKGRPGIFLENHEHASIETRTACRSLFCISLQMPSLDSLNLAKKYGPGCSRKDCNTINIHHSPWKQSTNVFQCLPQRKHWGLTSEMAAKWSSNALRAIARKHWHSRHSPQSSTVVLNMDTAIGNPEVRWQIWAPKKKKKKTNPYSVGYRSAPKLVSPIPHFPWRCWKVPNVCKGVCPLQTDSKSTAHFGHKLWDHEYHIFCSHTLSHFGYFRWGQKQREGKNSAYGTAQDVRNAKLWKSSTIQRSCSWIYPWHFAVTKHRSTNIAQQIQRWNKNHNRSMEQMAYRPLGNAGHASV